MEKTFRRRVNTAGNAAGSNGDENEEDEVGQLEEMRRMTERLKHNIFAIEDTMFKQGHIHSNGIAIGGKTKLQIREFFSQVGALIQHLDSQEMMKDISLIYVAGAQITVLCKNYTKNKTTMDKLVNMIKSRNQDHKLACWLNGGQKHYWRQSPRQSLMR